MFVKQQLFYETIITTDSLTASRNVTFGVKKTVVV